jgi:hypothetical protein
MNILLMDVISLKNVTLFGVDCVNLDRLIAAAEVSQKYIEFGDVKLLSHLPSSDVPITIIDPITSIDQYSRFIMKEAYKYVDTEYMLVIQADGFVINPFNWTNEFLQYDYLGATWPYNDDYNVGNGGFSLRSKKLMAAVAADSAINKYHPEDFHICRTFGNYLKKRGFTFAPDTIANQFSVEGRKWEGQFGFHNADISTWEIEKFTDKVRHAKYIDVFYKLFRPLAFPGQGQ